MSLLTGELAFLWASIVSVPVALAIQTCLNWFWRWGPIQRIVMPGADECRVLEHSLAAALAQDKPLTPGWAQVGAALLQRNGMNAIANALIFAVVFTGSHALLMAL